MIEDLDPIYGHRPEDMEITCIGAKPGEKLYEEPMNQEEVRRSMALERYFVVAPAFARMYRTVGYQYPGIVTASVTEPYNSANQGALKQEGLRQFLKTYHL
jgi:FlaA1/EpsC-like NDP-sugar epimerase